MLLSKKHFSPFDVLFDVLMWSNILNFFVLVSPLQDLRFSFDVFICSVSIQKFLSGRWTICRECLHSFLILLIKEKLKKKQIASRTSTFSNLIIVTPISSNNSSPTEVNSFKRDIKSYKFECNCRLCRQVVRNLGFL